jgi:hypothetical protein
MNAMPYVIHSEEEAWNILRSSLENIDVDKSAFSIDFSGWPTFDVYLNIGNGSLTPSVMKIFIEFQEELLRSFALLKYGEANITRLTHAERKSLEFEVAVRTGSSDSKINLSEIFKQFVLEAAKKMTGKQLAATIITIGLAYCGSAVWRDYIAQRTELRKAEIITEDKRSVLNTIKILSENETSRIKLYQTSLGRSDLLRDVNDMAEEVKLTFLLNLPEESEAVFQGTAISGYVANELARNPRNEARSFNFRGAFRVLSVDTQSAEGFKVKLRHAETLEEFQAFLPDDDGSRNLKQIIQDAEWRKRTVELAIEAVRLGGRIRSAIIKDAEHSEDGWAARTVSLGS